MTTMTCYVLKKFLQEKHEESITDCTEGIYKLLYLYDEICGIKQTEPYLCISHMISIRSLTNCVYLD